MAIVEKLAFKDYLRSLPNNYDYDGNDMILIRDVDANIMKHVTLDQVFKYFYGDLDIQVNYTDIGIEWRLDDDSDWKILISWIDLKDKFDIDASNVSFNNDKYNTVEEALNKLLYIPIQINNFTGGGNYEIGTIPTIKLSWSYNKPIQSQSLDQGIGSVELSVREFIIPFKVSENTVFTLTSNDGEEEVSKSVNVKFYKSIFYGAVDLIPTDSDSVRSLNKSLILSTSDTYTLNTGIINKTFSIAIPNEYNLKSVIDINNAQTNIVSAFELINDNIIVNDGGGNPLKYKLYMLSNAIPYSQDNPLRISIN